MPSCIDTFPALKTTPLAESVGHGLWFVATVTIGPCTFQSFFHFGVRRKVEKQKVLDKYDNIEKEKPAENYTRITFAANTEVLKVTYLSIVQAML